MNYIVSDWLNKMALCFHALAMCTRPIFSENGKLAFRHRGTASHMCKIGQTRSFTPKNRFQVVLKAVVHRCSPRRHCCENWPGLGVKCHFYSLLTGLSSIFKDSSLQVRSPHREYNTRSSTTVYLTILQDRLHTVSSSLYICVCTPQDLVVFS